MRLELRPRHPDLRPAEAEPDERLRPVVEGVRQGGVGGLQAGLARDVVDPPQHDAVVALGGDPRVLDGLGVRLDGDAAHDRRVGRHRQLGVAHLLPGEVPGDLVGEHPHVLGGAQQADRREVHVDEVREVGEAEEAGELLRVLRHRAVGVPPGELGDDPRRRRPHVVHVQLGLGQARDERAEVGSCGGSVVGGHGRQCAGCRAAAALASAPGRPKPGGGPWPGPVGKGP